MLSVHSTVLSTRLEQVYDIGNIDRSIFVDLRSHIVNFGIGLCARTDGFHPSTLMSANPPHDCGTLRSRFTDECWFANVDP